MSNNNQALIAVIVDAIKGYFSIIGLILVGVYLIKNPEEAAFGFHLLNYLGGWVAMITGTAIGGWYTVYLAKTIHPGSGAGFLNRMKRVVWGMFVGSTVLIIVTVVTGAITMSCGSLIR
jgi:hypothetical protein